MSATPAIVAALVMKLRAGLTHNRRVCTALAGCLAMAIVAVDDLSAQMLARPGWNGSAVAAQAWSKRAVIYEIDPRSFEDSDGDGAGDHIGAIKGITQHLDYLQALGVDAILLDSLLPPAGESEKLATPIDPALGTVDDFDDLALQASRNNIRILLALPQAHAGLARFWLTRGIAGFYIPGGAEVNGTGLQAIQKLLSTSLGQRVLMTDANHAGAKTPPGELSLDTAMLKLARSHTAPAGQLRQAIEEAQKDAGSSVLVSDATGLARSVDRLGGAGDAAARAGLTKIVGAVLLLGRSGAMLYQGQELALSSPDCKPVAMPWGSQPITKAPAPPPPKAAAPGEYVPYVPYVPPPAPPKPMQPDPASAAGQALDQTSVLNFYRQLIQLHRGNGTLRDGEEIVLNHDDQNALVWVRKPARPTYQNPAVFVVCNLSGKPLSLSLKADIARLHLRGSFLHAMLRSDAALATTSIDPVTLPGYGVFVGELKY